MKFDNVDLNLTILAEEAAEVIQAICKVKRFGMNSENPLDEEPRTNNEMLERELGDFIAMVDILIDQGVICPKGLYLATEAKRKRLENWYG